MLGLVIADHQTGVDDPGDPAQEREQKAQEEAENAAGQEDRDGRKDNAEEVAKGFQIP